MNGANWLAERDVILEGQERREIQKKWRKATTTPYRRNSAEMRSEKYAATRRLTASTLLFHLSPSMNVFVPRLTIIYGTAWEVTESRKKRGQQRNPHNDRLRSSVPRRGVSGKIEWTWCYTLTLISYIGMQTNIHRLLPAVMGPSRSRREDDSAYKPRLSNDERLKRGRAAVAKHYKKYCILTATANYGLLNRHSSHPEMREKKKIQMREARQVFKLKKVLSLTTLHRAQKKLAKRRWDPPKKPKSNAAERLEWLLCSYDLTDTRYSAQDSTNACEAGDTTEAEGQGNGEIPPGWTREYSLTVSDFDGGSHQPQPPRRLAAIPGEDEVIASQVLSSMYLARKLEDQREERRTIGHGTRESGPARVLHDWSPLPPSLPPPPSTPDTPEFRQAMPDNPEWRQATPPESSAQINQALTLEWDGPESPLPRHALERMPWRQLFQRWAGGEGGTQSRKRKKH
ncbi:hypothetical protein B0H13DRAFT_1880540 [Mycena leptocephala]|nr:hypothetical protein B0H13DRAFT_1880540 [Mycena leptocephala]